MSTRTEDSTLPGCFGLKKPLPPNNCKNCQFREDCSRYVPRTTLKPLIAHALQIVERAEATIQGVKMSEELELYKARACCCGN